jgi:hypothetical protein
MSPEGGEASQVTQEWVFGVRESADGKYLYYGKNASIWRVPVEGGEEEQILEERVRLFDIVKDRLYYGKDRSEGGFSIHYRDLKTKSDTPVHQQEGPLSLRSIDVAPDEKWIYFAFNDTTESRDIMLIENFR